MAPKKSHGPRAKAASGTSKNKTSSSVPDSDHIVFTNNQSSSKPQGREDVPAPLRPDVKKIIGGASWTGKVPVNLLSEHCQRQKWDKPEYAMRRAPQGEGGGYQCAVTLSATNAKTKETTTLSAFELPLDHRHLARQPTPLEARHFAAAYALFRVSSMKNIHMTLPPQYRDLWKGEFLSIKQEDVDAGRGWKYDADPFAAEAERQRILSDLAKKKAKKAVEAAAHPSLAMAGSDHSGEKRPYRAWEQAFKAEMGDRTRADIEDLIRRHAKWNAYGVSLSGEKKLAIVNELSKLGFRRSHAEEAVQKCKDREETLEWLLIHVPEDDLPSWSFPEKYSAGISLASGDPAKESKLRKLAFAGFSMDMCAKALRETGGNEDLAAESLQNKLMTVAHDRTLYPRNFPQPHVPFPPATTSVFSDATLTSTKDCGLQDGDGLSESTQQWNDEMMTAEAIFGERFSRELASCTVTSEVYPGLKFQFRRPSRSYPFTPPIIAVHGDKLPAHVRLSAIRQALLFADTILGDPMIFSLVEWLETHLPMVLESPGPLSDIVEHQEQGLGLEANHCQPDKRVWAAPKSAIEQRRIALRTEQNDSRITQDPALSEAWKRRQSTSALQNMIKARRTLPAWSMQGAIVEAIDAYQCVIISGETGSGKSTQSVQFVLDHLLCHGRFARILCTQPRRISAIGLAERVSNERCTELGDEVGYVIRGESKMSQKTEITFMTTGVLLRRLQSSAGMVESLENITHIFVDEVHERSLDTDFLLALLRDAMKLLPQLKIVLMSATLDAQVFSDYFRKPSIEASLVAPHVGHVHISGRTFPVRDLYLDDLTGLIGGREDSAYGIGNEDERDGFPTSKRIPSLGMGINYELICNLVRHVNDELGNSPGGVLIFLPGTLEIERCMTAIRNIPRTHGLPLHASLLPAEQRRVFLPPPQGTRKVVCATNVAETSITIEDIVAVIDSGRVKETNYNPTDNIVQLSEVWASKAACKQRRGRAGRVSAGTCYKLFTRAVEARMACQPEPEIRRVPLEQLCLAVKATGCDRDVALFLRQTLTPPEERAVESALNLLQRMGALWDNRLTALGRHLTMIPSDLRCAKLLVYASVFGCVESCLTIAAILTVKSPFLSPRDKRDEAKTARQAFSQGHGDLLLDLRAYNEWCEQIKQRRYNNVQEWCSTSFLSQHTLREISSTRSQLLSSLKDAGLLPLDYRPSGSPQHNLYNSQNENHLLLRALVAGALNPQIARIDFPDKKFAASMAGAVELDPEARTIKYTTHQNGRVFLHPSSVLFDAQTYSGSAAYLAYFTKMATSKTFIRDLTREYMHLPPATHLMATDTIYSLQRLYPSPLRRCNRDRHTRMGPESRWVAPSPCLGKDRRFGIEVTYAAGRSTTEEDRPSRLSRGRHWRHRDR